jgi:hypothetical protein
MSIGEADGATCVLYQGCVIPSFGTVNMVNYVFNTKFTYNTIVFKTILGVPISDPKWTRFAPKYP